MGCVNRSSSEFKNLAARNNLDSNALELIVHKYWLETGNETLFPTDVYIQAQLGNSEYQESGKYVREMWKRQYSSPQEFASMDSLQTAYNEALKYFPESAIVYYRNAEGNLALSVRRPVEKTDYNKDDFFEEYDNVGSMRNVKVLNLGIKDTEVYGIDKVQQLYNRFNTDKTSQALADKVFGIAKDLGLNISFNESLPFGTMGRYSNSNTIVYKKSFLERDIMNNKKASVLLHEVLHSLSMYALSKQTKNWKRPEALQQFRTEVNSLYQDLKNNPALKGERGVVDVKEFVAELANPVFRVKIQQIDKENKTDKKNRSSFWSRVLNAFKTLLGLHSSNSYYQRSMNALDKALDAFDIDTYMRYNGIKSQLRKEVANNNVKAQYNKGLAVIDNAARSGVWTVEALQELDNLIKNIEDGKVIYKRFPQEASRAYRQGGRANEAASLLLRTNESSSTKNSRSFSESQRRSQEEKPIQERIIEHWAKAKGIWYDHLDTVKGKELLAEGGEAKVFANEGDAKVTKVISTKYFTQVSDLYDKLK